MAEAGVLTLAYVSAHPTDAARVLESVAPEEAAALLAALPARAAAPALIAMLPPRAAQLLHSLDDHGALALLSAAGAHGAVAILRHIPEPRRSLLLRGLPTATAVTSQMLLGFPEDTIGAWTDPAMVALAPNTDAGAALARVREEREAYVSDIYVTAEGGRLKGVVALVDLLRASESTPLSALMRAPHATLPVAMPLSAALAHPAWQRTSILPVVERGERVIGVLRAARLHEAVSHRTARPADDETTLAGLAAAGYWGAVSGLVESGLALLPRAERVMPEER